MGFCFCSCHDQRDYSAAVKAIIICVWCVCMAGYYHSFAEGCAKMPGGPKASLAYYDFWRRADHTDAKVCYDTKAVSVMSYFACYLITMFLSCVGGLLICCGFKGYNKAYSIFVIACWIWLSIQDWWTIGAMLSYFADIVPEDQLDTDSELGYLRNEFGFRIAAIWIAESFLFLNSAWDAWDRSDSEEQMTQHLMAK